MVFSTLLVGYIWNIRVFCSGGYLLWGSHIGFYYLEQNLRRRELEVWAMLFGSFLVVLQGRIESGIPVCSASALTPTLSTFWNFLISIATSWLLDGLHKPLLYRSVGLLPLSKRLKCSLWKLRRVKEVFWGGRVQTLMGISFLFYLCQWETFLGVMLEILAWLCFLDYTVCSEIV